MVCVPSPFGVAVVSQSNVQVPIAPEPPVGAEVAVPLHIPLQDKGVVVIFKSNASGPTKIKSSDSKQPFASVAATVFTPSQSVPAVSRLDNSKEVGHVYEIMPVPPKANTCPVPSQLSGQLGLVVTGGKIAKAVGSTTPTLSSQSLNISQSSLARNV